MILIHDKNADPEFDRWKQIFEERSKAIKLLETSGLEGEEFVIAEIVLHYFIKGKPFPYNKYNVTAANILLQEAVSENCFTDITIPEYKILQAYRHFDEKFLIDFTESEWRILEVVTNIINRVTGERNRLPERKNVGKVPREKIVDMDYIINHIGAGDVIIPIAAPASGKSYLRKKIEDAYGDNVFAYGLDDIRAESIGTTMDNITDEEYTRAFVENKGKPLIQKLVNTMNNHLAPIKYLDLTHLTRKRRKYVKRVKGDNYIAIMFISQLDVLFERNSKRAYQVPEEVIREMVYSVEYPSFSEFDEIYYVIN